MSDQKTVHYRTCNLCEAMCGLEVEIDGEDVVSIRGDERDVFSRGYVCPKATALKDLYEDPDRLTRPVRRFGSRWERISWEEAFDEVVSRIHRIQAEHGSDAVGVYLGNPNAHNLGTLIVGLPFLRTLGSSNRFSATSCDQLPLMLASYLMYGHQLLLPIPDVDRTDFMLLIGANPLVSNGSIMAAPGIKQRLEGIRKRGGKVIVVDPRRSETARLADEHVFIQPGTDALFLLGLLHEVCAAGIDLGRLAADCEERGSDHRARESVPAREERDDHPRPIPNGQTIGRRAPSCSEGRGVRPDRRMHARIRRPLYVVGQRPQRGDRQSRRARRLAVRVARNRRARRPWSIRPEQRLLWALAKSRPGSPGVWG